MASSAMIAKRYSKALFELAESLPTAKLWINSMELLVKATQDSPELKDLMRSPAFGKEEKWNVLSQLTEQYRVPQKAADFLKYLTEADRIELLEEIFTDFRNLVHNRENSVDATVETAIPLDENQTLKIKQLLEKWTNKNVLLDVQVKPELLAGLRVHVMGKTLDASLTATLESMNRQFRVAQA